MLEPSPGRKPIVIANKTVDQIKQQAGKGEKMHFSAPVLSYIPPPAPKRRPTIPHIDPPPLSLTPASLSLTHASPDTNIGTQSKVKKCARSLVAHSLPTYGPNNYLDFGSPEDLNLLDDGGKDLERVGKRVSQLSTITEKHPSLGSSPTIFSLLHTERLSASKEGRSSSLSSVSSKAQSIEDSKSSGQELDLFELEQSLPSGAPDELQFEMETGLEVHPDGGESGDYLPNFT